jgi:thiamine-monophosphate kinase
MRTEIASLGEFGLIDRLTGGFSPKNASTLTAAGDDAAVLNHGGRKTVVSTDLLLEGIHFDLHYTPLKHLGYKAVVVNLSDIYAMNARPEQIVIGLAVSNRFSVEALDELYAGIRLACENYGVDLVGGDTSASDKGLFLNVTAIGTATAEQLAYRHGARPGDVLCVTGDLGGAYVGLQLLEREKRLFLENPNIQPDLENQTYILGRQLKPEARKDIVELFEQAHLVPTSMIDVSDGLTSDLLHLCKASGVGALVEEALVPIHPDTYQQSLKFQVDPTTAALHGGEDYELLFTIAPGDVEKIRYMMDVKIIGEMVPAEDGVRLQSKGGNFYPLTAQGWTHF